MIPAKLETRQREELAVSGDEKTKDLFIFSTDMIAELQLIALARQVLALAAHLLPERPALPAPRGGRPPQYPGETILVSILVMSVWQISPETLMKRMKRWPALASACGFTGGEIISASQLRRRRDSLGLWVYFMMFCTFVYILIERRMIVGRDWVIDSTLMDAFSRHDQQAGWSFTKRFGYKVHLLLCRDSISPKTSSLLSLIFSRLFRRSFIILAGLVNANWLLKPGLDNFVTSAVNADTLNAFSLF